MDDFNNNTPSGNEQQNAPESTGNFQSAPEAGNDAQRANSGSPYNGGYQPNNGYPYSNGGGNTNNGSSNANGSNNGYSNANGSNNGYSSGNNGYYGSNGAYRPSSTYSGNNSYVYYGNSGQPPKKPVDNKPSKHKKGGVIALIIAVVVCVALGVTGIAVSLSNKDGAKKQTSEKTSADSSTVTINETPTASSTDKSGSLTAAGVYDKIKDSSVGILVYSDSRSSSASGQGSGVIVGEDSSKQYTYIMTCAHVISGGGSVRVQLSDETQYDATVVGYDSKTDIGVLKIKATGLKAAEFGDSDKLSVGETVYAIGNPGGTAFAGSFTNGIVSAISRPVNSQIGYEMICIQHTAAINPGNSGGALVNEYGQVIGINSSKIASTDYEGMAFSVPSVTAKEVYDEIVANGYVTNRPKLGITYSPASSSQMYSMIVSLKELPAGSLIVQSVQSDSSLASQDVKQGDLITKVNGKDLDSADDLPDLIDKSAVGDTLTLTICRIDSNYNINEFEVKATLVEDKGDSSSVKTESTTRSNSYNPFSAYGYGN